MMRTVSVWKQLVAQVHLIVILPQNKSVVLVMVSYLAILMGYKDVAIMMIIRHHIVKIMMKMENVFVLNAGQLCVQLIKKRQRNGTVVVPQKISSLGEIISSVLK